MAGAQSLGSIYAELRLALDKFNKDINEAKLKMQGFSDEAASGLGKLSTAGSKTSAVGASVTRGLTAPIVGVGIAAVKVTKDFESSMSLVKSVSGATGGEYKKLRDLALEMGRKTKFSALESADAMGELMKLGFDTNEVMKALPSTLALAAAGQLDLADASKIVAQSMNMFNENADQTSRYADVFAKAANIGALDVKTLGEALSYAGPSAAAMGMTLEETTGVLAVFSDAGIESTRAGTTFEAMLRDMKKSAMKNGGALKFMGKEGKAVSISMYDSAGKMRPLVDIIADLEGATKGMTDAERDAALAKVANTQGLRGLNVLLGKGAGYLADYTGQIENSKGAGQEMADVLQDNLAGALEQLMGSLETAGIVIGDTLAPMVRDLAESIKKLVDAYLLLSPEEQEAIVKAAMVVAALGPLLMIIGQVAQGIAAVVSFFGPLVSLFSTFFSLLGAGSGVMGALTAMFPSLGTVMSVLSGAISALGGVWSWLTGLFAGGSGLFAGLGTALSGALASIGTFVAGATGAVAAGLVAAAVALGVGLGVAIDKAMRAIFPNYQQWWDDLLNPLFDWMFDLGDSLSESWSKIVEGFTDFFAMLKGGEGIVDSFSIMLAEVFGVDLDALLGNVVGFVAGIENWFREGLTKAGEVVVGWVNSVKTWFSTMPTEIGAFLQELFFVKIPYWIGFGLGSAVDFVVTGVTNIVTAFTDVLSKVGPFLLDLFTVKIPYWVSFGLGTAVRLVMEGVQAVIQFFAELPAKIATFVTVTVAVVRTWASNVYTTMTQWVQRTVKQVTTFFVTLPARIKTALTNAMTAMKTWAAGVYTTMVTQVKLGVTAVITFFQQLPAKIAAFVALAKKTVVTWATNLVTTLKNAAVNAFNGFVAGIKGLPARVKQLMVDMKNTILGFGKSLLNAMKSVAASIWEGFKDGLGIHSPSYIERAVDNIMSATGSAVKQLKGDVASYAATMKPLMDDTSISSIRMLAPDSPKSGSGAPPSGSRITYNVTVNNPKPEPASASMRDTLLKASYGLV